MNLLKKFKFTILSESFRSSLFILVVSNHISVGLNADFTSGHGLAVRIFIKMGVLHFRNINQFEGGLGKGTAHMAGAIVSTVGHERTSPKN